MYAFGVPVAQRIERPPSKRQVVGSSPTGDAKPLFTRGTTRPLLSTIEAMPLVAVMEGGLRTIAISNPPVTASLRYERPLTHLALTSTCGKVCESTLRSEG